MTSRTLSFGVIVTVCVHTDDDTDHLSEQQVRDSAANLIARSITNALEGERNCAITVFPQSCAVSALTPAAQDQQLAEVFK